MDLALFGARDSDISGVGILATAIFRALGPGDPAIEFGEITTRNGANENVNVGSSLELGMPEQSGVPVKSLVYGNFPNPFNPRTRISYTLAEPAVVDLRIFDCSGRLVRILRSESPETAGNHELIWAGIDEQGRTVSSGAYFCRLDVDGMIAARRMILLK